MMPAILNFPVQPSNVPMWSKKAPHCGELRIKLICCTMEVLYEISLTYSQAYHDPFYGSIVKSWARIIIFPFLGIWTVIKKIFQLADMETETNSPNPEVWLSLRCCSSSSPNLVHLVRFLPLQRQDYSTLYEIICN